MDQINTAAPGLTFPCEYPVKAMGPHTDELMQSVWGIVSQHAPDTPSANCRTSQSRQGRFLSVTVTITAQSRDQLDAIYADLQAHSGVLATL